jgi:transglutaminase-like putative cysteine protease
MHISVTHSTSYRYEEPVYLGPHLIRLYPREDGSQRVLQQQLSVSPAPVGMARQLDQDGSVALQVWFDRPASQLSVMSSFAVETLRPNPFDFLLPPPAELRLPMRYSGQLARALAHYADPGGVDGAVRAFAEARSAAAGAEAMPFLMNVTETLCRDWKYVLRPQGASYPAEVTLRLGEGSCRDLAALFCEICRAMGLAARFVSGYERSAAEEGQAYMHAWAEVYIPGGGWRGYDPSRGVAVSDAHVPVASAADPEMAAPIAGLYMGKARSHMQAAISMQVSR